MQSTIVEVLSKLQSVMKLQAAWSPSEAKQSYLKHSECLNT